MMDTKLSFAEWLLNEIESRGWNRSDLARAARISPTAVSDVINGRRVAGTELCKGIAKAFSYPPDYVFRKAGLLPDLEEEELPGLDDLINLYRLGSDEDRREIVAFARFKIRP